MARAICIATFLGFALAHTPIAFAAERMVGGSRCEQSQTKLEHTILTYHLDCGDEQADVMEAPNPFGMGPRVVMASVKQLGGNSYIAGDGANGKTLTAAKGNHLPKGSEGYGRGRVEVLGQLWVCEPQQLGDAARRAGVAPSEMSESMHKVGITANSDCVLVP